MTEQDRDALLRALAGLAEALTATQLAVRDVQALLGGR